MKRMINSLLEYSRVHTEASEFTEIDVNEVFENTRQDLELLINEHDAQISADDLPTIEADRNQIGQVFQNLVKNGIEHASQAGVPEIEVTVSEQEDAYVFAVSDNGPGIPDGQHDEIFKIFQQGSAASSTDNTGIGLAITQRIVQRHGGAIWVASADTGATFKFTVPRDSNAPRQAGEYS
jgi:light-regulated signal transduction histidine kinase (bacteriophytochrome)